VGRDGTPDYRRHFCSRACTNEDKAEAMRAKRARFAGGKCPYCGRESTGDQKFKRGVSRHKAGQSAQKALADGQGAQDEGERPERR